MYRLYQYRYQLKHIELMVDPIIKVDFNKRMVDVLGESFPINFDVYRL